MTLNEIIKRSKAAGFHFFDRDSMEHWQSRTYPQVWSSERAGGHRGTERGHYFVTSELRSEDAPRMFTVRRFDQVTAQITVVDPHMGHATREAAAADAERAARFETAYRHDPKAVSLMSAGVTTELANAVLAAMFPR